MIRTSSDLAGDHLMLTLDGGIGKSQSALQEGRVLSSRSVCPLTTQSSPQNTLVRPAAGTVGAGGLG